LRTSSKVWIAAASLFTVVQFAASAFLSRGIALTTISDIASALLVLTLLIAFASNAALAQGRLRVFWVMQTFGWTVSLINQLWWMVYDVVLRKPVPMLFAGDVLLFLPGLMMLAGFLLRPHVEHSPSSARLGALDFLLLMVWWVFFYAYLVTCWQYVSPNEALYNRNYDRLYFIEILVVVSVLTHLIRHSSGSWRRFYLLYTGAILFNYLWFAIENHAIEQYTYFIGSWYDCPYIASFALFIVVALYGRGRQLCRESDQRETYRSWVTALAIIAVLSLPVMVLGAVLERNVSIQIMHFRVLVTAIAIFAMAALVFMKQYLLHEELRHSNLVLQWSSTTDPLTGTRNRRYLFENIQRDIAQSVRAHLEGNSRSTRDLIFYLIDLDNFKKINDTHGHDGGDRVLMEAARRISSVIRNSDLLVRWGGEEFLVVSRATDRRQADILAQRVLDAFREKPFTIDPGGQIQQTCSIGWAAFPWFEGDVEAIRFEGVLKFADRGLYRAKKAGKNQAVGMTSADGAVSGDSTERPAESLPGNASTANRGEFLEIIN
jgi:diguanylate cyclase (GGDEF)-like protein